MSGTNYIFSLYALFFLSFLCLANSDQLQSLLQIKSALQKSNPKAFSSWNFDNSPCTFDGILCNSNGAVIGIELSDKMLAGRFPWSSLKNMTDLVQLGLGDNPFDPSPFPVEVLQLTKLNWLYISNCSIEGEIPAGIGALKELLNLELADNNISGEIPKEIGKLEKLLKLELYNNSLSGKLPRGLGNLVKLEQFDASMNNLEGDLSELRTLTNLTSLQMFENRFSGEVPVEFGEFKKLVNLSLDTNKLTGVLPEKLGFWSQFIYIDVARNLLTGSIPPYMCKQGTMLKLVVLDNKFTGEIPASYANCTSLISFRVKNNSISGSVPAGIWGLPNVTIIDIEMNQLVGEISSDIKKAKALTELKAGFNKLSGEVPEEISQASSLVSVELNNNQIFGKIPDSIGELKQLINLELQNNKLSGQIPTSISSCVSLNVLNMSNNSISGKIPPSLGYLPVLDSLSLSKNHLSGQIPESLSSLDLILFDLSDNNLTGPIPQSLTNAANHRSFDGNSGLCSSTIKTFRPCPPKFHVPIIIIGCAIGLLILFMFLGCFLYMRRRGNDHQQKEDSWEMKSFRMMTFNDEEILDSIKPDNIIGEGSSGTVYRALLSNGVTLAVKHILNTDSEGRRVSSREFNTEAETLSSIRHTNVVTLYGTMTSEGSSLLVYEYMSNGSLRSKLHTNERHELDWDSRYNIALGAARGIQYLHHECPRPIIHRDIKSSNILLDDTLKPKIGDFGFAKIAQANYRHDSTRGVVGTHGYIAPEYCYTYQVSEKSDVYSFGVILLELVTGRKPLDAEEYGQNNTIVHWVHNKLQASKNMLGTIDIVDSMIPIDFKEDVIKVLKVAVMCTSTDPGDRPNMRDVVEMLVAARKPKPQPEYSTEAPSQEGNEIQEIEMASTSHKLEAIPEFCEELSSNK